MTDNKLIRQVALDQAINSKSGNDYDGEGRIIINPDKIIEAAKKFETYLKGTNAND